ncbi:Stk1 family PASTA domain-containing Ser/Thr kinase [Pseudarthrobacter sp. J1738]|uniref:Stk1 family PASTA domain-containing Ser/Thr kinase n=1 Tax=Pseudarthrobacter sp. J1738 TaxID=3420446 RepID=UPI003D2BF1E9
MSSQRVLSGRYEVGDLIGRGGMADVHRGVDTRLGRTVAIKLLRADFARDPQFLARFRREAQSVAALNHSSIVAIYDSGEQLLGEAGPDALRAPYIVMEYVAGRTLRDLIKSEEVTVDQAIGYTLGVLSALEYSHDSGIIHRDIKPANVMVSENTNAVKVMDFGIARAIADSSATMTQTQAVVGTAQYLSPEQALGETVDSRSDLYSAACMLYELLTFRPPFVGDSPVSVAYQHVRQTAEPASSINPQVPEAVDSVLAIAMRKNRKDRFQTAGEFRRALRAARSGVFLHPGDGVEVRTDPNDVIPDSERTEGLLAVGDAETQAHNFAMVEADDAPSPLTDTAQEIDGLPLVLPPERDRTRQQKSRRRGWIATFIVFALLVLVGGGLWLYMQLTQKPAPPVKVQVPAVSKLLESDALNKLYGAQLKPVTHEVADATVPKGQAIGTVPAAGTSMDPNSEVTLNISTGPSSAVIPKTIAGMTEAAARDILRQLGLVGAPTTTFANSVTVPGNRVISTNPAAGATVPIGSTVQIVVSTGKVAVPEMRGKTVAEAEALLKPLGLTLSVTEVENPNTDVTGKITDQVDAANSSVDQGSALAVSVAKAAPTPTPTPTPTSTATNTGAGSGSGPNPPKGKSKN